MEIEDLEDHNFLDIDVSSEGNNVEHCTDVVLDYSNEFTTYEVFKSREAMVKWTREVGRRNGFVVIIKTSDAGTQTKKPRVTFGCEREGSYAPPKKVIDDPQNKRRKTGTKKCGCPFTLKGKKLENNDDWSLVVICGVHNHPSFEYREGHTFAGRLNNEESKFVVDLSKCSVQPKIIFNALKKQNPDNASNMKAIYNARQKLKVAEKAGRTNMQLLMSKVVENNYIEFHRSCENTKHVKDLFFAHPFGVDLLHTFPRVLIMDCTYKTNRFNIPLFQIVGMTSTEKSFSAAFAFIENEKEENYRWALERLCTLMDDSELPQVIVTDRELALMNAIDKIFPMAKHMICSWHIEKNIAANCKKTLGSKKMWDKFNSAWNMIVYSSTKEDYHRHVTTLNNDFSRFPDAIKYVTNSWLNPYKERFVSAWTDTYMHFGNTTTNRVESQHAKLKKQLQTSQHNYETVWTLIDASLLSQHTHIKESFEKSKIVLPLAYKPTHLFEDIKGLVSTSALDYIFNETKNLDSIGKDAVSCGCELRRTHGLPCAHEIAKYDREYMVIPLESIDVHWTRLSTVPVKNMSADCQPELELLKNRFDSLVGSAKMHFKLKMQELGDPSKTLLLEPKVKKNKRGRPKGKKDKADKSTKRDPSAFEYVHFDTPDLLPIFSDTILESTSGSKLPVQKKKKNKVLPPLKVYGTQCNMAKPSLEVKQNSDRFKHAFPIALRPYISEIKNVESDGNCGYRAIANLIGYGGQNAWVRVRKELLEELHTYESHYMNIYPGVYKEIEKSLEWFDESKNAPMDYWLDMPTMGHLIACRYNVVLYFFSMSICCTLLPLRTHPESMESRKEIAIGFVNKDHFVQMFMTPSHPVPPIIYHWEAWSSPFCSGWATPYIERIEQWKQEVNPSLKKVTFLNIWDDSDNVSFE